MSSLEITHYLGRKRWDGQEAFESFDLQIKPDGSGLIVVLGEIDGDGVMTLRPDELQRLRDFLNEHLRKEKD